MKMRQRRRKLTDGRKRLCFVFPSGAVISIPKSTHHPVKKLTKFLKAFA